MKQKSLLFPVISELHLYLGMKRRDICHVFLHSANVLVTRKLFSLSKYFTLGINCFFSFWTRFPFTWCILFSWVIHHWSNSFWWWITCTCYQMGLFWYSCIIQRITLIYQQPELWLWLCAWVSYITECSYMHTDLWKQCTITWCPPWCPSVRFSSRYVKSGLSRLLGQLIEETPGQQIRLRLRRALMFGSCNLKAVQNHCHGTFGHLRQSSEMCSYPAAVFEILGL